MKKICFLMMAALLSTATMAQTAKSVLDKAAANITVKEGVKANFKMTGGIGNTSGTILIKGKKFHATTPKAIVWFDGKTMWTYMKDNEEVNVSTPTEAQLQAIVHQYGEHRCHDDEDIEQYEYPVEVEHLGNEELFK